jgi:flagellar biosynthesis protein FlhB
MNIEELRQEMREDCGDQHLKSMRKADAQALSLADLEQRVKRSKVVVVQRKRL